VTLIASIALIRHKTAQADYDLLIKLLKGHERELGKRTV